MKTYKDIYKFPLHKWDGASFVSDSANNFVFQFEPKFNDKGDYQEGWLDTEEKIMNCLNGVYQFANKDLSFYHNEGQIFAKEKQHELHVITIRGWGNLTGTGAHNLKAEEAANIQDTFAEYIVEQLNKRNEPVLAVTQTPKE